MAVPRDISREHPDLAIGDLARRPRILTRHPARRLALLQESGRVDHQHRVRIGQRPLGIVADNVAQCIRIPAAAAQNGLLPLRTRIAGRLGAHPARLALLAEQTVQKPLRRRRKLPAKHRSHPRLHIRQQRRPNLKRRLDRCSNPSMTSESWKFMDSEIRRMRNCNARVTASGATLSS